VAVTVPDVELAKPPRTISWNAHNVDATLLVGREQVIQVAAHIGIKEAASRFGQRCGGQLEADPRGAGEVGSPDETRACTGGEP
jgi:hypothetical protein